MKSDHSNKKDGFKHVWKETDWNKMHISRLRAAVGKGLTRKKPKGAWDRANRAQGFIGHFCPLVVYGLLDFMEAGVFFGFF